MSRRQELEHRVLVLETFAAGLMHGRGIEPPECLLRGSRPQPAPRWRQLRRRAACLLERELSMYASWVDWKATPLTVWALARWATPQMRMQAWLAGYALMLGVSTRGRARFLIHTPEYGEGVAAGLEASRELGGVL